MPNILEEVKSWISLAKCGVNFHGYAAREILNCIRLKRELSRNGTLCDILRSAMGRHDWKGVLQFALDWSDPYSLPTASITKFQPGDHYHVLDRKFDTWSEANAYLEKQGYRRGISHTVYVPREGD